DILDKGPDDLLDYLIKDICLDINGSVDLENKVLPALDHLTKRYKSASDIPPTDFQEDLVVVNKQFLELLNLGFLDPSVLSHDSKADPHQKNLSEDGKKILNRCKLAIGLMSKFCSLENIHGLELVFSKTLHDTIANDFRLLGIEDACLKELVQDKTDSVFRSLKTISELLQTWIAVENTNRIKNIQFMAPTSDVKPQSEERWYSGIVRWWQGQPEAEAKPAATLGQ
ncbi:uncharacterized protein VICG_02207, partial [Vittaforma corneae ATCC 50505]